MRTTLGALAAASLAAFSASAQEFTLHGTVFGGPLPLAGASVVATAPGSSVAVDNDTTDSTGFYSLSLPAGTWNLTVTPPSTSSFGQQTVHGLVITGDATWNVILIQVAAGTLYGTLRAPGGAPLPNVNVEAVNSDGVLAGIQTSDADGNFSMVVGAGTFKVIYYNNVAFSAVEPQQWDCTRTNVVVNGSANADFDAPFAQVAGQIKGSDGATLPGTTFDGHFSGTDSSTHTTCESPNISGSSASGGAYAFNAVYGNGTINLHPPTGYGPASVGLTLSGNVQQDLIVPAFTSTLGGTVIVNGTPISNSSVSVYTQPGNQLIATHGTDSTGHFQFLVGDGTYKLVAGTGFPRSAVEPMGWDCTRTNVLVSGSATADVSFTAFRLSGQVLEEGGTPLANVNFNAFGSAAAGSSPSTTCESSVGGGSDSTGAYAFMLVPSSYTFSLQPPAGSGAGPLQQVVTVSADLAHDFVLPAFDKPLTGTVTANGVTPLANVSVMLFTQADFQFVGTQTTDAAGAFKFLVAPGSYRIQFNSHSPASPAEPAVWDCRRTNIVVTNSGTANLNLPLKQLFATFTDPNGVPVANVALATSSTAFFDSASGSFCDDTVAGFSTATGGITQWVMPTTYTFFVFPPNGSGFLPLTLNGVSVVQSPTTFAFILPLPDVTPPAIVSGPTVIHLSDDSVSIAWVTDEASNSTVQYGIGGLTQTAAQDGFVTQHSVTLTGLTPGQVYEFRVRSTDRFGNGPTVSPQGTFTTQAGPGDVTPPVFTVPASIVFVDTSSAIVQWKTDEPATSVVRWGTSAGALTNTVSDPSGTFGVQHSITITGLSPGTNYFARAESADPDGNGPAVSGVLPFTTLAAPDLTAPLILDGPTLVSKTDHSIVVRWITNEPADSGVSYNDGTAYGLVSDPALTTEHVMTISGLHAQTTYHLTVSSTDAAGNGPALGGPINATTLATPDTTPPSFTIQPSAATTDTTATITWTTNEASDSGIVFGINPGAPTGGKAELALVTSHSLLLTGLAMGQTYSAVASSTDASGNRATSSQFSFTTTQSTSPGVSCVGTLTEPVVLHTAPHTCGATADASNAGACTNGTCTFGGAGSVALAPGRREVAVVSTASDGRTASCTSFFDVRDGEAPKIACPAPATVECTGALTAARPSATCTDNCGCEAGCAAGQYARGVWNVSCEASDSAGNLDGCTAQVTVVDTKPPSISMTASPSVLWPPNHKLVPISIGTAVSDDCDSGSTSAPAVHCTASSSEPADPGPDIVWEGSQLYLRSERLGTGPGRTYTITCTATDAAGNAQTATARVLVPHDQGN